MKQNSILFLLTTLFFIDFCTANPSESVAIGSKKFTENIILGDIISHLSQELGYDTNHKKELGGTRVLWQALLNGDIDIYPEYMGTLKQEILAPYDIGHNQNLDSLLSTLGVALSKPLGFNNTYAIGVKKDVALKLELETISDLVTYPHLAIGFTNEFMDRQDGWPGLQKTYNLPQKNVRGLDHDLAYRGLETGSIQIIDMYSTDAEIKYYDLKTLIDDLGYFPNYDAVYLYRLDLEDRAPSLISKIDQLSGRISESQMVSMNARAKLEQVSESQVAADFVNTIFQTDIKTKRISFWQRLWINTKAHLFLVVISLTMAVILAIPLGIIAAKYNRFEQLVLGLTGIIQTIPSLALLVFMIPLLGIGGPPAIVALFLYSLLPIVRSTFTGIRTIPQALQESALALGLPAFTRLKKIELPLASPSILSGIKTSAVINVGTATLGALIGAGGYGQPILTGIRLDDVSLILQGAAPAALLALLVQWLFDVLEKILVPKGIRQIR